MFGGCVFQQTVGIPMSTNCIHPLAELFFYSYDAYFLQGLLKKNEKKLVRSCNFTFRDFDDVLSLNISRLGDFLIASIPLSLNKNVDIHLVLTMRFCNNLYQVRSKSKGWKAK